MHIIHESNAFLEEPKKAAEDESLTGTYTVSKKCGDSALLNPSQISQLGLP